MRITETAFFQGPEEVANGHNVLHRGMLRYKSPELVSKDKWVVVDLSASSDTQRSAEGLVGSSQKVEEGLHSSRGSHAKILASNIKDFCIASDHGHHDTRESVSYLVKWEER